MLDVDYLNASHMDDEFGTEKEMSQKTIAEIIADIVAANTDPRRALDRVKGELGVSDDVRDFQDQGRDEIDHDSFEDELLDAYDWRENPEHNVKIALAVYRPDLLLAPGIDDEYTDLEALKVRVEQEIALRTRAEEEKEELRVRRNTLEALLCGLVHQVTKHKLKSKLDQPSYLDLCRKEVMKSEDPGIRESAIDEDEVYAEARDKVMKTLSEREVRVLKERGL